MQRSKKARFGYSLYPGAPSQRAQCQEPLDEDFKFLQQAARDRRAPNHTLCMHPCNAFCSSYSPLGRVRIPTRGARDQGRRVRQARFDLCGSTLGVSEFGSSTLRVQNLSRRRHLRATRMKRTYAAERSFRQHGFASEKH